MNTRGIRAAVLLQAIFIVFVSGYACGQAPDGVVRMEPFKSRLGTPIENWRAMKGDHPEAIQPDFDDSGWKPSQPGQSWKGSSTCWFRTQFTVPAEESGKALFLEIGVDDAAMVYVDGEQLMQLSGFGSALLSKSAKGGRKYTIAVRAINTGGVGALTVASYRSLASDKLITIENALAKLAELKSVNSVQIREWLFKPSGGTSNADPEADTSDWEKVYIPHRIPETKAFGWYRTNFTIPEKINGYKYLDAPAFLVFDARTSGVLYVNGRKVKSFQEHVELEIPGSMKAGTEVTLALKVTDLSSRGNMSGAALRAAKLDPVVDVAGKLAAKLGTAKLYLEQIPRPAKAVTEAVEKIDKTLGEPAADAAQLASTLEKALASLSPLDAELASYPLFHQGPYLQNSKSDGMTVMWETMSPAPSAVYYGRNGLDKVVEDPELKTIHEITITGLQEETEYKYMAVSGKQASPEGTFKTSIKRDTPFVFAVWGDNRTDPKSHESVIDAMLPHNPDIALNVGDVVTHGSIYSQWSNEYFLPIRRLGMKIPTYISIGNHEYGGYGYGNPVEWFEKFVSHPEPNDYYFSFTYGNSYFMALNPQDEAGAYMIREGSDQYKWMIKEFESAAFRNAEFKFVFLHEPPYSECWSGGYYDGEPALRAGLVPLVEKYGVDIVFAGHTHDYERGQYPKPDGPYYIITGGGGSSLDDTKYKEWEQIDVYEFKYHFIKVSINDNKLKFEAIDRNGDMFDSFEIVN